MQQGEEHHVERGQPRPALLEKNILDVLQAVDIDHRTGCQIAHHQNRQHNFVRRQSQNEGHNDVPVQPEELGKWIEEGCHMAQDAVAADINISQYPGSHSGRRRNYDGARQHVQGFLFGGDEYRSPHLGLPVWRQLQRVMRGNAAKRRLRQYPGYA
ncbi:hypothetical protein D3C71_1556900 [compost metagenome]